MNFHSGAFRTPTPSGFLQQATAKGTSLLSVVNVAIVDLMQAQNAAGKNSKVASKTLSQAKKMISTLRTHVTDLQNVISSPKTTLARAQNLMISVKGSLQEYANLMQAFNEEK